MGPTARALYPRKRAVAACQLCRTRKTKCDNGRPSCGGCVNVGAECIYQSEKADLSSFDAATLAIIDRVNHVGSLVEAQAEELRNMTAQLYSHGTPGGDYHLLPNGNETSFPSNEEPRHGSMTNAPDNFTRFADQEDDTAISFESLELATICHGTCEDILEWPIFEGKHDRAATESIIFEAESLGDHSLPLRSRRASQANADYVGVHEEDVPELISIFLAQVHTKNPILDPVQLRKLAKDMSEHGFRWDADSCLVLLTCALACLASPFISATLPIRESNDESTDNALANTPNYSTAEKYYVAARKRIALLDHSIITTQCHFLSGVYEMYSLRPIRAWTSFNRACMTLQLCLRSGPALAQDKASKGVQRRLFWSCLKSECELRLEIHVPSSGLAKINPSDVFPTPPSGIQSPRLGAEQLLESNYSSDHIDQEQSWYYYLADIAVRKIINRLLNVFYREDALAWLSMPVERMTRIASEIDSQLTQWHSHLPAPVASRNADSEHDCNFDELKYYLHARIFEVRERLYRPFLYITISSPRDTILPNEIVSFARNCVGTCVAYCAQERNLHRHHGTWYHTRQLFRMGLLILAAAKSQRVDLPEDWPRAVRNAIAQLTYWENEAADVRKSREILQAILQEIEEQQSHQYHEAGGSWHSG